MFPFFVRFAVKQKQYRVRQRRGNYADTFSTILQKNNHELLENLTTYFNLLAQPKFKAISVAKCVLDGTTSVHLTMFRLTTFHLTTFHLNPKNNVSPNYVLPNYVSPNDIFT
jgi:hypothetical protein